MQNHIMRKQIQINLDMVNKSINTIKEASEHDKDESPPDN